MLLAGDFVGARPPSVGLHVTTAVGRAAHRPQAGSYKSPSFSSSWAQLGIIPMARDLWTIVEIPLAHARSDQK